MDKLKASKNVTFTVNYAEGEKMAVEEGLLFEFQGNNITLHLGTNRVSCLFAVVGAALESIQAFGLADEFDEYCKDVFGEEEEDGEIN